MSSLTAGSGRQEQRETLEGNRGRAASGVVPALPFPTAPPQPCLPNSWGAGAAEPRRRRAPGGLSPPHSGAGGPAESPRDADACLGRQGARARGARRGRGGRPAGGGGAARGPRLAWALRAAALGTRALPFPPASALARGPPRASLCARGAWETLSAPRAPTSRPPREACEEAGRGGGRRRPDPQRGAPAGPGPSASPASGLLGGAMTAGAAAAPPGAEQQGRPGAGGPAPPPAP